MHQFSFDPDCAIVLTTIIVVWVVSVFSFVSYHALLRIVPPPPPPQQHSLQNSPFRKLPLELVGYMAEFLTPPAAACFTLTCKPIWFIIGNQHLDQLWAQDFEPSRRIFLKLLDRDMPCHVLCLYCNQLHRGDIKRHRSLLLSLCGIRPPCEVAEIEQEVHRYTDPNFSYVQLQASRKIFDSKHNVEYRQRVFNMLRYNTFSGCYAYICEHASYIWFTGARFTYRKQDLLQFRNHGCLFSCNQKGCIACQGGGEDIVLAALLSLVICPHLQSPIKKAITKTRFESIMTCRSRHWNDKRLNETCPTCSGLHQCQTCPTEFQLDTVDCGIFDRRVGLALTRWLDLGEGRTREDPKWKSHIGSRDCSKEMPIPFEAGSIKAAFEQDQDQHYLFLSNWLLSRLGYIVPFKG